MSNKQSDSRLQLKSRLFWYRHYQKMHEMVSDGSSQVDFWTYLCEISMRILLNSKTTNQWQCGRSLGIEVLIIKINANFRFYQKYYMFSRFVRSFCSWFFLFTNKITQKQQTPKNVKFIIRIGKRTVTRCLFYSTSTFWYMSSPFLGLFLNCMFV